MKRTFHLPMPQKKALEALMGLLPKRLPQIPIRLRLFGSRARGDESKASDTDVAVIVDVPELDFSLKKRILNEIADIEIEYLAPLSTMVISERDLQELIRRERRLGLDIKNEGIDL